MDHKYSKFKDKTIPYAKVGERVFNDLFDAETFCTEQNLDVNSAIEYRDDPELKNNIQTIAWYQRAILQECSKRLERHLEKTDKKIETKKKQLSTCHPLDKEWVKESWRDLSHISIGIHDAWQIVWAMLMELEKLIRGGYM